MVYKLCTISLFTAGTGLAAVGLTSLWHDVGWERLITDAHWAEAEVDNGNIRLVLARRTNENPKQWGMGRPLGWLLR